MIFLSLFVSFPSDANPYYEEALKLSNDAEKKKGFYLEEAKALQRGVKPLLQEALNPKVSAHEISSCQANASDIETGEKEYLVFVSLSMPKEALQSLYEGSKSNGATLILRGLKEQSFKKTGEYLKELDIEVQIDPTLFKKYQIQKVPTFIWINQNEYHSLSGNISFQFAKQKFSEVTP